MVYKNILWIICWIPIDIFEIILERSKGSQLSIPECLKYIRLYFPCNAKQVVLPDCIWLEVVHHDRMNNLPFPVVGAEPACDIPENGCWEQ